MLDVIIIGAGIAGMTAGIYAVRAGKKVLILENKVEGGQIINTVDIENWPGDLGISGVDLTRKIKEHAEKLGVSFDYVDISKIKKDGDKFVAISDDGEEFMARSLIIATGTEPRKMSEEQTTSAGSRPISYCATCDGALYKGKKVVVVGHGNSAKHEVKYLEGICSKVYNIHHDEPIPEDAEAVFVAIGRIPNTAIFEGLVEMDSEGYIVADESCKTSCDGVFVAGDVRTKNLRQLVTAASDGAVAATEVINYLG